MNIRDLRKLASKLGVKNYSKMRKPDLQAAVDAAQNQQLPTKGDSCSVPASAINVLGRAVVGDEIDGEPAVNVLASMSKGDARRLRKALRAAGRTDLASLDIRQATLSRVAA